MLQEVISIQGFRKQLTEILVLNYIPEIVQRGSPTFNFFDMDLYMT